MSIDTPSTQADTESDTTTPRTGSTTFINTSGGLLTDELVSKLRQRQCGESAVRPETFALPNTEPPEEADLEAEIGDTWDTLRERWDELTMDESLFHMDVSDARNKWVLKLFQNLGFEPVFQRENLEAGGIEASLSHKGWPDGEIEGYGEMEGRTAPILHTVEPEQKLDEKPEDAPRGAKSPHDTLQEFLNASDEHDWAVVTNGLTLRVLRDFYHTYTRGYVEFDLENMFTSRNFGDFRALYRLCHTTRFIEPVVADQEDDNVETPLEQLYQVALSTGVKVGQDLQENVVRALETLGNGFLDTEIKSTLEKDGQEAAEDYYQDLLYVVYRLLFLMFAEQRGMMSQRDSLYTEEYSITKLRERAEQQEKGNRNTDLWEGLKATFDLVGEGDEHLNVPGYNGDLFDDDNLEYILDAKCPNEKLLSAVDDLTHIEQEGYRQRISYADLGVEEIGAVYESLLEFTPQLAHTTLELEDRTISPDSFYLDDRGMERKETGSYYTDPGLVDELVQSALRPVVENRVDDDASTDIQEQQLLDITVCDPACGSGAFLIAANNFLGQKLAEIQSSSLYPDERIIRQARRSVVQHCIYGIDLNPMAVELAKVSLWINSVVENKPLNFLDHRIKQGNSLIGTIPELVSQGVPEDAFETSKGRSWHKGNKIRKEVRQQNDGVQAGLGWDWNKEDDYVSIAEQLDEIEEEKIKDTYEKEKLFEDFKSSDALQHEKLVHDVWTAAFYWPLDGSIDRYPSPKAIEEIRRDPPEPSNKPAEELTGLQAVRAYATKISEEQDFFHWPLEFPAVYSSDGGFDCIIGNPPWETIELQDQEFFATRNPEIANAGTKSKRKTLVEDLKDEDPDLYQKYQNELQDSQNDKKFVKNSGIFSLTSTGHSNTYGLFAEHSMSNISAEGRSGIIVPTGIATDSNMQAFFQKLISEERLVSLFDFQNQSQIFKDVTGNYRFSLLTIAGDEVPVDKFEFMFMLTEIEDLRDQSRKFELTREDIRTINPNTKTCPTFRTRKDAELTLDIYKNVGALKNTEEESAGSWDLNIKRMFNASDDSGKFKTKSDLLEEELEQETNQFVSDDERYLPVYESKLVYQFDHRHATFEGVNGDVDNANPNQISDSKKDELDYLSLPRYWMTKSDYQDKDGSEWHLVLRNIARATDARTIISSIIPGYPTVHSLNHMEGISANEALLLVSSLNSYIVDYVAKQKISGMNISHYILRQMPIPAPEKFDEIYIGSTPVKNLITDRASELVYTSTDLDDFGSKIGEETPFNFTELNKSRRATRIDLEALLCIVYGLNQSQIKHIYDSFDQVKSSEYEKYGEYRLKNEVQEKVTSLQQRVTFE
jgi:hypothetical protein